MIQPGVTPGLNAAASPSIRSSSERDSHQPSGTAGLIRCQASTSCSSSSQATRGSSASKDTQRSSSGTPARISTSRRPRRLGSSQARSPVHCEQSLFSARKAALRHQSIRRRGRSAISTTSIQACTVGRAAPNARTASPQGESASTVASGSIDHASSTTAWSGPRPAPGHSD